MHKSCIIEAACMNIHKLLDMYYSEVYMTQCGDVTTSGVFFNNRSRYVIYIANRSLVNRLNQTHIHKHNNYDV